MLRILFYGLLIYLAYKVIFDLIIPVYKTTKKIKKGMREMDSRSNEQMKQQAGYQKKSSPSTSKKETIDDYIDFEEIK